jgi:hypothetical protein
VNPFRDKHLILQHCPTPKVDDTADQFHEHIAGAAIALANGVTKKFPTLSSVPFGYVSRTGLYIPFRTKSLGSTFTS